MRNGIMQRQKVWFVERTKVQKGIDTKYKYSTPIMKRVTVSSGSVTPEELSAGLNPDYDRYITSYDRSYIPQEGTLCYVDVEPELDDDDELVYEGGSPTMEPDYVVKRILNTKRGKIARFGIKQRGNGD